MNVFKKIFKYFFAFIGGIVTVFFFRNKTRRVDDIREQLGNSREQLTKAEGDIRQLNETIDDSQKRIDESRAIIEQIKQRKQ